MPRIFRWGIGKGAMPDILQNDLQIRAGELGVNFAGAAVDTVDGWKFRIRSDHWS